MSKCPTVQLQGHTLSIKRPFSKALIPLLYSGALEGQDLGCFLGNPGSRCSPYWWRDALCRVRHVQCEIRMNRSWDVVLVGWIPSINDMHHGHGRETLGDRASCLHSQCGRYTEIRQTSLSETWSVTHFYWIRHGQRRIYHVRIWVVPSKNLTLHCDYTPFIFTLWIACLWTHHASFVYMKNRSR